MLGPAEFSRRLRAARALAGLTVQQLADKLDEPGLGFGTLGAIERGERATRRRDLIVIADALGLPVDFFTLPLEELFQQKGRDAE